MHRAISPGSGTWKVADRFTAHCNHNGLVIVGVRVLSGNRGPALNANFASAGDRSQRFLIALLAHYFLVTAAGRIYPLGL